MMRYWRERFSLRVFLPAAAGLAVAARLGHSWNLSRTSGDSLVALLLLAQFRLWDDLADRQHDRVAHPDRWLSSPTNATRFVVSCAALGALNLVLSAWRGTRLSVFCLLALNAALGGWYAFRPRTRSAFTDFMLLLKYPAIVVVLSDVRTARPQILAMALLMTYAAACGYEAWHDPAAFRPPRAALRLRSRTRHVES
jgi:hypothetical protein